MISGILFISPYRKRAVNWLTLEKVPNTQLPPNLKRQKTGKLRRLAKQATVPKHSPRWTWTLVAKKIPVL